MVITILYPHVLDDFHLAKLCVLLFLHYLYSVTNML